MNAAKVPSESNNWDFLDIFLFSNGQEYSPPRKYHLRYEDLYFWETTLSLLARSQYGSLNSGINLFTLSGHMINSPLELINNGSYVAVSPPEIFIPAGYENYLIKASRSWERRHSKKASSHDQVEKAGEITIQSGVSSAGVTQEIINIKTPDQNITISAVGTVKADNLPQRSEQPEFANFQSNLTRNTVGSIKPTDRRKLSSSQPTPIETRTSILRKLTNTSNIAQSPASNKRHSSIRGRESKDYKENVKVTTKTNTTTNNSINLVYNTPIKLPNSLDNSVVPSTNVERGTNFTRISNASRRSETKENKPIDKTNDKDITLISNLYRSLDEMPSSFVDAAKTLLVEPKNPRRNSPQFQQPIPEENPDRKISPLIEEIMVRSSTVASMPQYSLPRHDVEITKVASKQSFGEPVKQSKKTDDQFTAVLNKGENVNLKLNIEVKNGECEVKPVVSHSPPKTRSLTEVRLEKDSSNKINPMFTSKSIDSLPSSNSNDCCQTFQKVFVIKCPCESQIGKTTRDNSKAKPAESDGRTYIIIVPIITRSVKECKESDVKTLSEKEVQNTPSLSKVNRTAVIPEYTNRSKDCEGDCCIQKDCCTIDNNEYVTIQRVSTATNNFQSEYILATQIDQECQKIEFKPGPCDTIFCIKDFKDEETQTEWCSVLLEVRRHGDGHYTFHLPPFEVVKMLNLSS